MCSSRSCLVLMLLTAVSPVETSAQQVYTVEAPSPIGQTIEKLRNREDRTAAIVVLGSRDDAAPYLRMELELADDRIYKRDLSEALRTIEARVHERNKERFRWWAKNRRFDLCTEVLADYPDRKDAAVMVSLLTPIVQEIGIEAADLLNIPLEHGNGLIPAKYFDQAREIRHVAEEKASIPRAVGSGDGRHLVRADTCELGPSCMFGWFVAVQCELRYLRSSNGDEWIQSMVFVNNGLTVRAADTSLFVCDGDIEFQERTRRKCVFVSNGSIRGSDVAQSIVAATGNISVSESTTHPSSLFYAGGKVAKVPRARAKENQKHLPFGIRFLDPKEFGLDLAAQNGGVQVMGISPESVFARFGVEDADVIVRIDDVAPKTIPDFRRALRTGVIREYVILHIRRGDQDLTRIVFLDGVPAPVAPHPREVNPE